MHVISATKIFADTCNTNCHIGRVKHHIKHVCNVYVLPLVPKGSPKSQKLVIAVVKAPELK